MKDDIDLDALRALHEPEGEYDLICSSCWGSDGERANWPCETAEILFTQNDIDDVLLAWKIYTKSDDARRYRNRMARGWGWQDEQNLLMRPFFKATLTTALSSPLYFEHGIDFTAPRSVSFTIVNDLKSVT